LFSIRIDSFHFLFLFYRISTENKAPSESGNTVEKEERIHERLQVIIREKLNVKPKPPSLLNLKVKPTKRLEKEQLNKSRKSFSKDVSDRRRNEQRSKSKERSSTKSKDHRGDSKSGHNDIGHRAYSSTYTSRDDRYKRDKKSPLGKFDKSSSGESTSRQEGYDTRDETHVQVSNLEDDGQASAVKQCSQDSSRQLHRSRSLDNTDLPLSITEVQQLVEAFKKLDKLNTTDSSSERTTSLPQDPRLAPRNSSSTVAATNETKTIDSSAGTSKKLTIATPPLPPPLPTTLSPLLTPVNKVLSSSAPSTPGSTSKPSPSLSDVLLKTLSSLRGGSKDVSRSAFLSGWPSPPSVERKSIEIPGLEPPGSPYWQEQRAFSVQKSKESSCSETALQVKDGSASSRSCPDSPLVRNSDEISQSRPNVINNKDIAPSPVINLQPVPLAVSKDSTSQHSHSFFTSPQATIEQNSSRPITKAEQTSAMALKKVMSILKQNANLQENTTSAHNVSPVKVNIVNSSTAGRVVKSILKKPDVDAVDSPSVSCTFVEEVTEQKSISESDDVQKEAKDSSAKVVSLSEYRLKRQNSAECTDVTNDASTTNMPSAASDDKIKARKVSNTNEQNTSSSTHTETSKDATNATAIVKVKDKIKADPRPEKSRYDSTVPKKRKRIVTIKHKDKTKEPKVTGGYDDMSDISDDELPAEDITSDISDIEKPDDFKESGWYNTPGRISFQLFFLKHFIGAYYPRNNSNFRMGMESLDVY